jgi:hypothetical protein
VYDYISFAEEHKDAFYPYTGNYEALKKADKIVLWSWPGSGKINDISKWRILSLIDFRVLYAYKDEQGREWGYIGMDPRSGYSSDDAWICLNDPANENIPAFYSPQPKAWQPPKSWYFMPILHHLLQTQSPKSSLLIISLVCLLVAVTAALILAFWRPNKGSESGKMN